MSLTPEQIALRRNTLGASEIAAVCGLDPFRGPWDVWADKLGLDIREDFAESDMGQSQASGDGAGAEVYQGRWR